MQYLIGSTLFVLAWAIFCVLLVFSYSPNPRVLVPKCVVHYFGRDKDTQPQQRQAEAKEQVSDDEILARLRNFTSSKMLDFQSLFRCPSYPFAQETWNAQEIRKSLMEDEKDNYGTVSNDPASLDDTDEETPDSNFNPCEFPPTLSAPQMKPKGVSHLAQKAERHRRRDTMDATEQRNPMSVIQYTMADSDQTDEFDSESDLLSIPTDDGNVEEKKNKKKKTQFLSQNSLEWYDSDLGINALLEKRENNQRESRIMYFNMAPENNDAMEVAKQISRLSASMLFYDSEKPVDELVDEQNKQFATGMQRNRSQSLDEGLDVGSTNPCAAGKVRRFGSLHFPLPDDDLEPEHIGQSLHVGMSADSDHDVSTGDEKCGETPAVRRKASPCSTQSIRACAKESDGSQPVESAFSHALKTVMSIAGKTIDTSPALDGVKPSEPKKEDDSCVEEKKKSEKESNILEASNLQGYVMPSFRFGHSQDAARAPEPKCNGGPSGSPDDKLGSTGAGATPQSGASLTIRASRENISPFIWHRIRAESNRSEPFAFGATGHEAGFHEDTTPTGLQQRNHHQGNVPALKKAAAISHDAFHAGNGRYLCHSNSIQSTDAILPPQKPCAVPCDPPSHTSPTDRTLSPKTGIPPTSNSVSLPGLKSRRCMPDAPALPGQQSLLCPKAATLASAWSSLSTPSGGASTPRGPNLARPASASSLRPAYTVGSPLACARSVSPCALRMGSSGFASPTGGDQARTDPTHDLASPAVSIPAAAAPDGADGIAGSWGGAVVPDATPRLSPRTPSSLAAKIGFPPSSPSSKLLQQSSERLRAFSSSSFSPRNNNTLQASPSRMRRPASPLHAGPLLGARRASKVGPVAAMAPIRGPSSPEPPVCADGAGTAGESGIAGLLAGEAGVAAHRSVASRSQTAPRPSRTDVKAGIAQMRPA